jgi:serine/threonine protein kinase
LKRGFIQGAICNDSNRDYLLKFQPNKSVMELIINTYLKTIKDPQYFLLPKYIFINKDNSYFYLIKKYNFDLNKYFNILEKNKKLFLLQNIIDIIWFLLNGSKLLHKNNIIHGDLKLENIVVKIDNHGNIVDKKIIDFDVSLFNIIPENIKNISKKIDKILHNKVPRGTKAYMFKDELMSPNSDIYSIGVIALILLYKSVKLMLHLDNKQKNNNNIKKLSLLRKSIDDDKIKIKILNKIEKIISSDKYQYFSNNNSDLFIKLKLFITECINIDNKYTVDEFLYNYHSVFSNKKIES